MAKASFFERSVRVRKTVKEQMVELNLTMAEAQELVNLFGHVSDWPDSPNNPGFKAAHSIRQALHGLGLRFQFTPEIRSGNIIYK